MKKLILFFGLLFFGLTSFGQALHPKGVRIGSNGYLIDSLQKVNDSINFYHGATIIPLRAGIKGGVKKSDSLNIFATPTQLKDTATSVRSTAQTYAHDTADVIRTDLRSDIHDTITTRNYPTRQTIHDTAQIIRGNITDTLTTRNFATQSALTDTASAIRGDMGTGSVTVTQLHDTANAVRTDAQGYVHDTIDAYNLNDTISLHDTVPFWSDTTSTIATQTYVANHGGSSSSDTTFKMSFIVGTTINAPTAGDSVLTNSGFANKHIEAFRDGLLQFYSSTEGIEHANTADSITVHPPFASGEKWVIEATDTSGWSTLALADTSLTTGLLAYYHAEESSGNLIDATGNENLTVYGSPTYHNTGIVNYCVDVKNSGDNFSNSNSSYWNPPVGGEYSISCWINLDSLPTVTGEDQYIVQMRRTTTHYYSIEVYISSVDNTVDFQLFDTDNDVFLYVYSDTILTTNKWYHIVAVATGTGNPMKIYVNNGIKTAGSEGMPDKDVVTMDGKMNIGNQYDASPGSLRGKIDEIRLYNRALTASEVQTIYNLEK